MSDTPAKEPTKDQVEHARQAGEKMRDIATLLKDCVFPGALALRVAAAISWLERSAAAMPGVDDVAKAGKADAKRERKRLKLAKTAPKEEAKDDGKAST